MPWQLAISFSIIANVATTIIQRRYSQRSLAPHTFPPAVSYLLGVTPMGIIVGLSLPHHVHWSHWLILLLIFESCAMAIANWLMFKTIRRLPVAHYQTISQFTNVVVISLGWLLLKEKLNIYQIFGAILLLSGAVLAARAPMKNISSEHRTLHLKTVLLALAASGALGIGLVTEKAVLGHMQIGANFIFGWSAQTFAMLLLASKDVTKQTLKKFGKHEIKWSAMMGWANALTGVFYVEAIVKSNNISRVTAILAITLPLVALAAYLILKERDRRKLLWSGLALGFLGLLISAIP